jgi:hypothetical protein
LTFFHSLSRFFSIFLILSFQRSLSAAHSAQAWFLISP